MNVNDAEILEEIALLERQADAGGPLAAWARQEAITKRVKFGLNPRVTAYPALPGVSDEEEEPAPVEVLNKVADPKRDLKKARRRLQKSRKRVKKLEKLQK